MVRKDASKLALWVIGVALSSPAVRAESCADISVALPDAMPRSRMQLTADIGKLLHRSVIGEFMDAGTDTITPPRSGTDTLADVVRLMGSGGSVHCVIQGQVIHLYESAALSASENALNHIFLEFDVPDVADLFVIRFRSRLQREAFLPSGTLVSGSDGGATSNDAGQYPLKAERVLNSSARDLLMREANALPMVFAVTIQQSSTDSLLSAWSKAAKKMLFFVER